MIKTRGQQELSVNRASAEIVGIFMWFWHSTVLVFFRYYIEIIHCTLFIEIKTNTCQELKKKSIYVCIHLLDVFITIRYTLKAVERFTKIPKYE